jgi:AcrR family transcriptional regulator
VNDATPLELNAPARRCRDREASERRIRDAAVELFARFGYDEVTVRMIAAEADVNVALINRYFGSKFNLFSAAVAAESAPKDLSNLTPEELPGYLARRGVHPRDDRPALRALYRSASVPEVRELLRQLVETTVIDQISAHLTTSDARERARTATAILMGIATARAVFHQRDLPEEQLIERLTAIFHHCLFDE